MRSLFFWYLEQLLGWSRGESNPYPSAVQRRRDTLLALSGDCKVATNKGISTLWLFLIFQKIY